MVTKVKGSVSQDVIRVSSRTAMKAIPAAAGVQYSLEEGGRSGQFVVKAGTPPADTLEGVYVVLDNGNYAERLKKYPTNVDWFGADPDTTTSFDGTDNAPIFLAANTVSKNLVIPEPPVGFAYGVTQWSLKRNTVIQGPGQYCLAILGLSSSDTVVGGGDGDLKREITINDLYVKNQKAGDAVNLEYCPDFNLNRVYFRSEGASATRGLNLRNSERGHFSGQCRFGGNPALRLVKDCNSVSGDRVICSGGSLGLAVDISGCQQVRLPLTIETSLQGVRIANNTGDNLTEGGFSSGIDLSNSYFESVGTPIVAGEGFAVNGVSLDNCWLNNGALSDNLPFPVSAEILRLGRVKNLSLKGGRWVGAGTEIALKALDFVVTSGSAPGQIEGLDVDLTVFEDVASLVDYSAIVSLANRANAAAHNKIKVDDAGRGLGTVSEWVSPVLSANATYGAAQITGVNTNGGRVISAELIEGDGGSLSGARIRIGSGVSSAEILDKTYGAVNLAYDDLGVTSGFMRGASYLTFLLSAGAGAGTFRVKIKYITDSSL
jgi:hypothetical protein